MNVLRPVVLALTLGLAAVPHAAHAGWGVEVNRASSADVNDLVLAEQELWSSEKAIARAVGQGEVIVRQRQLLGIARDTDSPQRLFQLTFAWWLNSVLKPAAAIAVNPAASCVEAKLASTKLFEVNRQRQVFGLAAGNDPATDADAAAADRLIEEISGLLVQAVLRRCHEEALDECVYTGRMAAVLEQAIAEQRQTQLLGQDYDSAWVTDALDQCAIYKLNFTSTGSVRRTANTEGYERQVQGGVVVRPGLAGLPGGLSGLGLSGLDVLSLEAAPLTGTDSNTLINWVTCQGTDPSAGDGRVVADTCRPIGVDVGPTTVAVRAFDLRHFTYVIDSKDFSAPGPDKVRLDAVGTDQLTLMFVPGPLSIPESSHIEIAGQKIPGNSTPEVFASIYQGAHVGEASAGVVFPPGEAPSVLVNRKDGYPVLLRHTLVGTGPGARGEVYTDTTEFKFSHQPEPKPFAPRDTSAIVHIDQKIDELATLSDPAPAPPPPSPSPVPSPSPAPSSSSPSPQQSDNPIAPPDVQARPETSSVEWLIGLAAAAALGLAIVLGRYLRQRSA